MEMDNLNLFERIKAIEKRLEEIEQRLSSIENRYRGPIPRPGPPFPPEPVGPGRRPQPDPFWF